MLKQLLVVIQTTMDKFLSVLTVGIKRLWIILGCLVCLAAVVTTIWFMIALVVQVSPWFIILILLIATIPLYVWAEDKLEKRQYDGN